MGEAVALLAGDGEGEGLGLKLFMDIKKLKEDGVFNVAVAVKITYKRQQWLKVFTTLFSSLGSIKSFETNQYPIPASPKKKQVLYKYYF